MKSKVKAAAEGRGARKPRGASGWVLTLLTAAALAACGGNGGNDPVLNVPSDPVPAAIAPAFGSAPASVTVIAGQPATFSVVVSGEPAPSLQWQSSTDGQAWAAIDGATAATYTFTPTIEQSGLRLRVRATNASGSAESAPAVLTVEPVPVAPTFSGMPPSAVTVIAGETLSLVVGVAGTPTPAVTWEQSVDGGRTWSVVSGATGPTLTIDKVMPDLDGRMYRAVATNGSGKLTTDPTTISVSAVSPAFGKKLEALTVPAGGAAVLAVDLIGTPTPKVQWQRSVDGVNWIDIDGATSASYTLTPYQTALWSGQQFRAVLSSVLGSATTNAATMTAAGAAECLTAAVPGWCQPVSRADNVPIHGAAAAGSDSFVAVGDKGTVLRSTDGGLTWTSALAPTLRYGLRSVAFIDDQQHGAAVGDWGQAVVTSDSGKTWIPVNSTVTTNLTAISRFRGNAMVAVGAYGVIIESANAGSTWKGVTSPTSAPLYGVAAAADGSAAVAVGSGVIVRATEPGNWTLASTAVGQLRGVAFGSGGVVLAVGGGTALRSADGGATWTDITASLPGLTDARGVIHQQGRFTIHGAQVYSSTDGGVTWTYEGDAAVSPLRWLGKARAAGR